MLGGLTNPLRASLGRAWMWGPAAQQHPGVCGGILSSRGAAIDKAMYSVANTDEGESDKWMAVQLLSPARLQ